MSNTPRTDAISQDSWATYEMLARTLERELAYKGWLFQHAANSLIAVTAERDVLKADKERLDWADKCSGVWCLRLRLPSEKDMPNFPLRSAIDDARNISKRERLDDWREKHAGDEIRAREIAREAKDEISQD